MQVEADWKEFYATLKKVTGLDLALYKQDQLQRRLKSMMESRGISGVAEWAERSTPTPMKPPR